MLFPSNTEVQQSYWKQRLKANQNPSVSGHDRAESERTGVEGSTTQNARILSALFVSSKEEIPETVKLIESTLRVGSGMALLQEMEKEKMEQVSVC